MSKSTAMCDECKGTDVNRVTTEVWNTELGAWGNADTPTIECAKCGVTSVSIESVETPLDPLMKTIGVQTLIQNLGDLNKNLPIFIFFAEALYAIKLEDIDLSISDRIDINLNLDANRRQ